MFQTSFPAGRPSNARANRTVRGGGPGGDGGATAEALGAAAGAAEGPHPAVMSERATKMAPRRVRGTTAVWHGRLGMGGSNRNIQGFNAYSLLQGDNLSGI